ncbi:MAG: hypothetical protein SPF17_03890 [Candidatus Mucispirillum faecigallinarum]|nr:hypothetical protein [Candidatus Mucispirillum faecigallinarum]
MKKIILMITLLAFIIAGCAEESKNNAGNNNTGGATAEQIAKVDDAFTAEFKKYVVNDDNTAYSGTFSINADTNIKAILQNITGRGGMPAASGIGEISNEQVAAAIAKIIAQKDFSSPVLYYSALDKTSNEFLASVMQVFMTENGMSLITELKHIRNNQSSIISLSESIKTSLGQESVSEDAYNNIVYLSSSLISYLKNNATSGIVGIKQEYILPDNKEMLNKIAAAFMAQGDYTSNYNNWNKPTPDFTVMPILANGGSMPQAVQTMIALMQKLTNIFVEYGYAESSTNSGSDTGSTDNAGESEEVLQPLGMFEQVFPAMLLKSFDDAPVLENAMSSYPVMPTNRAIEFLRAMQERGAVYPVSFDPVLYNRTLTPIIADALKTAGYNYERFNKSSADFQVISFLDTDNGKAMITAFNEAQNTAANINQ